MFDKIYRKVWTKIIQPDRIEYSKDDLGPALEFYDETWYSHREDIVITNNLNNELEVSIYWPKTNQMNTSKEEGSPDKVEGMEQENSEDHYDKLINCVIYCHSHNGCRVQGVWLKEFLIPNNIALVVFDFKASGKSGGDYVTMGWHETFDIDAVIRKVKSTNKIDKIALWGRSMGAASILFYSSPKFRFEMERQISLTRNSSNRMFHTLDDISCVIVDSPFDN